ncbi:uncharacterized protein EV420DRAFT_979905 [Desarmillaria tabescens]|uniref:Uncharacterized protein n=1 Tax=Armillaria tabescens TaxID=1929756 RepID=A0AA39JLS7_ARMTA|nr:uncharacterized protein EV420DRAFT_979905 [Desarmillaria tabescens]KAK0444998.1 hypothetical protein EV420DRAFT_979905 [Desarmillaria tabescens]
MDGYRHEVELYNPYEPQPEAGPSTTEYKNEARTGLLTQSPQQRPDKSWLQHGLCFTLHGLLVCVHFLILLIWITRAEHDVTVPIGRRSSIISTAIVQVSQIIGTLYLAGLIFVSQQLGGRRNARTRQTLTATSDNMAAWFGLGAALASLVPSLLVVGYFVCIAILNTTTPAIFSLQPFNQTRSTVIATTLGKPNISVNSLAVSNPPMNFWLDSTSVVPYLAHSDRASRIGLENGTLYDVISNNGGKGTVSMNATTFNVSCGYIDNASVTDNGHSGNWSVSTSYQDTANSIPVLAPNAFKWLPLYPHTLKDPWRHAAFYTSANITDSNGSNGVRVSLNPPMQPSAHIDQSRMNASNFSESAVYSMQIIGCTISLINQSAAIDAESHLLQHVSPSGVKNTSQWSSWQPGSIPAKVSTVSALSQSTKITGRAEETAPPAPPGSNSPPASRDGNGGVGGAAPQGPNPNPVPPNNGGGGEENPGEGNRTPQVAAPQDPTPNPAPPSNSGGSGNGDGGVGGAAPQDSSPKPAPPSNDGGGGGGGGGQPLNQNPGAPAPTPQDSNPNPAPPSDGGTSGGDRPQFASPQDPSPNPAPPNNGGNPPQPPNPNPTPAPENPPNPNAAPSNNDGDTPPQNSNPNPAPDGGRGDLHPFPAPQNPKANPPPPTNGGGSSSGNGGDGNGNGNGGGGNGGGGGGGNSGQGTNAPGQGQEQSNPPTAQSDSSGQGQSNSGQGATSPQGGGGQGDGQQNSNFSTAGQPPSDNSNTSPQNSPSAQGQDTTGGQQNPPGTGNPAPAGNGDTSNGNTPGQSNSSDGAGQNGGGAGDGSQGMGGAGGTSGQDSGGQPGTGDTNRQGGGGQNGGGAGDNSDGSRDGGGTGDTSGQGGGGQNGGAESTGNNGSNSGAGGQGSVTGQPTSHGAEQPTGTSNSAAMITVTSMKIVNATMTATAVRNSGTPATVSYYDSSDVFLGVWWELFNQAALSRFPSTDDCPGQPWQNPDACNPFTVIEQYGIASFVDLS